MQRLAVVRDHHLLMTSQICNDEIAGLICAKALRPRRLTDNVELSGESKPWSGFPNEADPPQTSEDAFDYLIDHNYVSPSPPIPARVEGARHPSPYEVYVEDDHYSRQRKDTLVADASNWHWYQERQTSKHLLLNARYVQHEHNTDVKSTELKLEANDVFPRSIHRPIPMRVIDIAVQSILLDNI